MSSEVKGPGLQLGPSASSQSMLTSTRRLLSKTCAISPFSAHNSRSTCLKASVMPAARTDESAKAAPLHPDRSLKDEVAETQSLAEQCERVHKRVCELLERPPGSERVRQVQQQTRISLGVIGEALEKYR